ncbi:Uncharacterized protein GBIM_01092 [Gryllus bimaculatus]|nr:Uncharacterized protein GBIM_01092 [Gryllus bimaculatus]
METDDVYSVCWARLRQRFTRRNEALAASQWVGVGPGNKNVGLPPQNLTLLNEEGREIEGGALGPFAEGASTVVRCVAEGGRPLPQVSWWRDGAPLAAEEAALQAQQQAFAQSTLRVGPLARADLGSELQCRAANSDLVPPLRRSLAIDLLRECTLRLVFRGRPPRLSRPPPARRDFAWLALDGRSRWASPGWPTALPCRFESRATEAAEFSFVLIPASLFEIDL